MLNEATKKKNVIMLLDNAFNPDTRVYKEAKYLINNNINVKILCLDKKNKFKDKPYEIKNGIEVQRFFCRTEGITKLIEKNKIINKFKSIIYLFWLIKFIKQVKKYLRKENFDILHCHDLVMAFCGVCFFKNKKIVFDMHEYYSNRKNKFINWCINKIVKYTQKKSTWIIHVNQFQIKDIKEKDKLIFLPNYPERKTFENLKKTNSDEIRINYTGYVRHYIPLLNLIKAVNELKNVKVSINGSGDAYYKLKEEEGKLKNFVLTGPYEYDDIAKFYENSDLTYIVYNKGNKNDENAFPTKFFESIVTGTPVIVSKNTELGNFVKENEIGIVVDGTDYIDIKTKLQEIASNKDILKKMKYNIQKISENFIWENVARNLNKIYNEYI